MILELRNSNDARRYVIQGLWLARLAAPTAESVPVSLRLATELLTGGDPLPPTGLIADVGRLISGNEGHHHPVAKSSGTLDPLPRDVMQRYEDYVLGKLYADGGFERGVTAICRYAERDRVRGTAWLIARLVERSGIGGVPLSPNVIRRLLQRPADEVLAEGAESLRRDGLMPLLAESYDRLIERVRNLGDVLGVEDVFELEHGTVLVEFGQRLALRQLLQATAQLEAAMPRCPPRNVSRHRNIPTHLLDEDAYPVGGFSSLSNHGTIESLLHSQLAYMEPEGAERPDLFDIKFLRGELLYYARDENEFLRRRRTIVFLLSPELEQARLKDADVPWQRIILVLASLVAIVQRLLEWLSDEALHIDILVTSTARGTELAQECQLLELALGDQIAQGTVRIERVPSSQVIPRLDEAARHSLTTAVQYSMYEDAAIAPNAVPLRLRVNQPQPTLRTSDGPADLEPDELNGWSSAIRQMVIELMQASG